MPQALSWRSRAGKISRVVPMRNELLRAHFGSILTTTLACNRASA